MCDRELVNFAWDAENSPKNYTIQWTSISSQVVGTNQIGKEICPFFKYVNFGEGFFIFFFLPDFSIYREFVDLVYRVGIPFSSQQSKRWKRSSHRREEVGCKSRTHLGQYHKGPPGAGLSTATASSAQHSRLGWLAGWRTDDDLGVENMRWDFFGGSGERWVFR